MAIACASLVFAAVACNNGSKKGEAATEATETVEVSADSCSCCAADSTKCASCDSTKCASCDSTKCASCESCEGCEKAE